LRKPRCSQVVRAAQLGLQLSVGAFVISRLIRSHICGSVSPPKMGISGLRSPSKNIHVSTVVTFMLSVPRVHEITQDASEQAGKKTNVIAASSFFELVSIIASLPAEVRDQTHNQSEGRNTHQCSSTSRRQGYATLYPCWPNPRICSEKRLTSGRIPKRS
jgi:hypothetical protein